MYDNNMTGFTRWDYDLAPPRLSPEWLARQRHATQLEREINAPVMVNHRPEPLPMPDKGMMYPEWLLQDYADQQDRGDAMNAEDDRLRRLFQRSLFGKMTSFHGVPMTPRATITWTDRNGQWKELADQNRLDEIRQNMVEGLGNKWNQRSMAALGPEPEQPAEQPNMGESPEQKALRIAQNFHRMYGEEEGNRRIASLIPRNAPISSGMSDVNSPVYSADLAAARSQLFKPQERPYYASPETPRSWPSQADLGRPEYGGIPRQTMSPAAGMDFSGMGPADIPDMRTLTHPNYGIPGLPQAEPPIAEFVRWLQRMFPLVQHYEQKTPEGWRSTLVPQDPRNR